MLSKFKFEYVTYERILPELINRGGVVMTNRGKEVAVVVKMPINEVDVNRACSLLMSLLEED